MQEYDIAVIGGGINGCGVARDAAGRGLSVLLAEQGDLAAATSSASSKLAHGGLRYLEHCAFGLVRESLRERETLRAAAPHLVRPLRFIFPHIPQMRPAWLLRCGLLLYDWLTPGGGGNRLPRSRAVPLRGTAEGAPLAGAAGAGAKLGFAFYDCWADDARLTVATAVDAARRGATVWTRTRCEGAAVETAGGEKKWRLQFSGAAGAAGTAGEARAKCLVNAAGPWAGEFLQKIAAGAGEKNGPKKLPLRLVQGSHIVLPALYEGEQAYILQNDDGRAVFAIPYENRYTLVGTTDRDFSGDPAAAAASAEETDYLLRVVRRYFGGGAREIVRSFSGVRPLAAAAGGAAQKANRDYVLDLQFIGGGGRAAGGGGADGAPLLNIYGGKLTTYRKLAETALDKLAAAGVFPAASPAWSGAAPLPGGVLPPGGLDEVARTLRARAPRLGEQNAVRIARAYGGEASAFLPAADAVDGGEKWKLIGGDLFAWEADYLIREEWATTADDILWRRSALGMHFSAAEKTALADYIRNRLQ